MLKRKDLLLAKNYPEDWKTVGDRRGWQKCLEDHCAELKGHRVVWRKDADPYRVKLVRSTIRLKQAERSLSKY